MFVSQIVTTVPFQLQFKSSKPKLSVFSVEFGQTIDGTTLLRDRTAEQKSEIVITAILKKNMPLFTT